ncbi:MAG: hypothetical protein M1536_07315 [Firmicutes bacterium]|nr:hypothetical protein [Bacillota bacterium]
MNKIIAFLTVTVILAVFLCSFSFAGEIKTKPESAQNATVEQTVVSKVETEKTSIPEVIEGKTIEQTQTPQETEVIFIPVSRGISENLNQDWVREFDRKIYSPLDIGALNIFWKKGDGIFRFNLVEPLSQGSDSALISWSYPTLNVEADTAGIYRRLGVFSQSEVLNGSNIIISPSPGGAFAAPFSGTANGMLLNLAAPDEKYFMYYRNSNIKVTAGNPFKTQFYASLWSDERSGHQQLRLRDVTVNNNPIGELPQNWIPYGLGMRTNDLDLGFDTHIGKVALRGSYLSSNFTNTIPGLPLMVSDTPATPPSIPTVLDFPGFSGNGLRLTANAPLGKKTVVYADFLSKDRKNSFSEYDAKINYFRGGISFRPNNNWLFSGTYRNFDTRTAINGGWTVPFPGDMDPAATSVPRHDYSHTLYQVDARYTGWKRVKIGAGYKIEKDKRSNLERITHIVNDFGGDLGSGFAVELNIPNLNNTKKLFYFTLSARPVDTVDFNLDYRNQTADRDDFTRGDPANYQKWAVDLNYTPNELISMYLNYYNLKEHNVGVVDYQFDNNLSSTTAGFWATPMGRWGIGGFWSKEEGDSTFNFNWAGATIFGADGPGGVDMGGTNIQFGPQVSTYTHSSQTWGATGMVPFGRAFRLWGKFSRTDSRGSFPNTIFNNMAVLNGPDPNNPGIGANTITNLNPLDTRSMMFNIGIEWNLKSNSTLRFDFVRGTWVDNINITNNGAYNSFWASWFTKW